MVPKAQKRKAQNGSFNEAPKAKQDKKSKVNDKKPNFQDKKKPDAQKSKANNKEPKPEREVLKEVAVQNQKAKSPKQQQKPKKQIETPEKKNQSSDAKPGSKRKADQEIVKQFAKRSRKISEVDNAILAENEKRLQEQKKRTVYIALPGKLGQISDSVLKALHPDVLSVKRISHAAFLLFSSEAVRDKALPTLSKAQLNNKPIHVNNCGERSAETAKPKHLCTGLNLNQLVVSDLPVNTTQNMLEIVFPKANDVKILKKQHVAYVNFNDEQNAMEAFKKGKNLKISAVPVVVRFRFADINEKPAQETKKTETKKNESDAVNKKDKSVKKEIETAQKAKKMLESGEIKPKLSKKELEKAVPMFAEDSDDEEFDEEAEDFDGFEDGFEDAEFESEFEDSDGDQTFDAELVTKGGKLQLASLKTKPADKKAEVKALTKTASVSDKKAQAKQVELDSEDGSDVDSAEFEDNLDELMEDLEDEEELEEMEDEDSEESEDSDE
ncbi:Nucleolin-like protein [Aphelenchoides bicaudatus]|nr:Nucleolin-like protein [Aphelenchoides bicaudatus]